MVVLKKNESVCIFESKQVGDLYHVCNAEAIAKYIAPTDTLSASGKFQNYLKGGNNYISFTRNKRFIVNVESTQQFVLFRFVVDGDSLSENYSITPYNDFAYNVDTGNRIRDTKNIPTKTEFEEIVKGPIKHFSRYIKKILFSYYIKKFLTNPAFDLSIVSTLVENMKLCQSYVNKNNIEYSSFMKDWDDGNSLVLNKVVTSYNDVVHLFEILCSIRQGSAQYLNEYKRIFNTEVFCVRDFLIHNLSYNMILDLIPKNYYKNMLYRNSISLSDIETRDLIEKYPPEINNKSKRELKVIIDVLNTSGYNSGLTKDDIDHLTPSMLDGFIKWCVDIDGDSHSPFHHLLFSTFFKPLLNYDLIVEDIGISKFIPGKSIRGYELIKALEKENILSKEDLISFLFPNI